MIIFAVANNISDGVFINFFIVKNKYKFLVVPLSFDLAKAGNKAPLVIRGQCNGLIFLLLRCFFAQEARLGRATYVPSLVIAKILLWMVLEHHLGSKDPTMARFFLC